MFDQSHKGAAAPGRGASTAGAGVGPGKQTRVEQAQGHAGAGHAGKGGKAGGHVDDDNSAMTDGQIHIITAGGLRHLRQANPRAARILFDNPNAYIVLKDGQHVPHGWKGKSTVLFPSFGLFQAAVDDKAIPATVDAVVYDNEHWPQTPDNEKADPSLFAHKFLTLARAHNLTFIAAPTRKFFAADAKYAEIIDVQLQDREFHTGAYLKAMRHDIRLAHHENPDVKVVGQITSNVKHLDPGQHATLATAERHAETDILEGENPRGKHVPGLDGFWGYLYQGSHPGPKRKHSVEAGDHILADLANEEAHGKKTV